MNLITDSGRSIYQLKCILWTQFTQKNEKPLKTGKFLGKNFFVVKKWIFSRRSLIADRKNKKNCDKQTKPNVKIRQNISLKLVICQLFEFEILKTFLFSFDYMNSVTINIVTLQMYLVSWKYEMKREKNCDYSLKHSLYSLHMMPFDNQVQPMVPFLEWRHHIEHSECHRIFVFALKWAIHTMASYTIALLRSLSKLKEGKNQRKKYKLPKLIMVSIYRLFCIISHVTDDYHLSITCNSTSKSTNLLKL